MATLKKIKEPKIIQEKQTWLEFVISMENSLTEGERQEMLKSEGSLTKDQIDKLVHSIIF
jgi:hypothetical protein